METKMTFKITALTIFVFFVSGFTLSNLTAKPNPSAQEVDLVDLKKKEEKRKKKGKKSKYVVTNDNIDKIKVPKKSYGFIKVEKKDDKGKALNDQLPTGESGTATTQENKAEGAGTTSAGTEKDKRAYWKEQMRDILIGIRDLKRDINQNQVELNRWEMNWSAIDDPIKQKEKREKIKELRELVPQQQKELAELQEKKKNLETRARKEGIPPGWLRVDDLDKKKSTKKDKDPDKENKQSND